MTTASCDDPKVFDAYIRERFLRGKKSEAAKVVEQFAKDAPLSEAVLLAIESLTTRESKDLRRVVDQFHASCEWHDVWVPKGWELKNRLSNAVTVVSPPVVDMADNDTNAPDERLVAAAANATSAKYHDQWEIDDKHGLTRIVTKFILR